jgi:hypothetical protein
MLWTSLIVALMQPIGVAAAFTPAVEAAGGGERIAKEKPTDDGYWKIEASSERGDRRLAIDKALYRAAELARLGGHRYVEMHDAYSSADRFRESATLFARAADAPVAPQRCRSGKAKRCYTADVAAVLQRLSGTSGNEPGVATPTSIDKYGRTVTESGFGIGAIAR